MTRSIALSRGIAALAITAVLAGCSTLPRDGPTGRNVVRGASNVSAAGGYAILDLTYAASEAIKAAPPAYFGSLQDGASTDAPPTIGSGDVLAVSIFEPSGGLFAGARNSGATVSSSNETLPAIVVDGSGAISIPFAGPVQVAGLTPAQAASAIRRALIGKVANPQVVVSISQNAYNTVTVIGAVRSPGRAPLSSNTDRLIDAIAARGGTERAPEDVQVAIVRDGQTFFAPLSLVNTRFEENIRLKRGDQINLIYQPRRFSTFGALGAVALTSMETGSTSLADAISRVGGLDTNSANARSVLVFRFERPEVASALGVTQPARSRGVPIVYRLNLEQAEGFFIASNFEIQPDDILYVPRSGSAELGKFFTLVRSLSGVVSDISIANTLNNN